MRDQELDDIKQTNDFGITIINNLRISDQCTAASKKRNMTLGLFQGIFFITNCQMFGKDSMQHS